MTTPSPEPSPDTIIRDIHRIREAIVEAFEGDLHALAADARRRQAQEGRPVWKGPSSKKLRSDRLTRS
jgi:hypothetical protein